MVTTGCQGRRKIREGPTGLLQLDGGSCHAWCYDMSVQSIVDKKPKDQVIVIEVYEMKQLEN